MQPSKYSTEALTRVIKIKNSIGSIFFTSSPPSKYVTLVSKSFKLTLINISYDKEHLIVLLSEKSSKHFNIFLN